MGYNQRDERPDIRHLGGFVKEHWANAIRIPEMLCDLIPNWKSYVASIAVSKGKYDTIGAHIKFKPHDLLNESSVMEEQDFSCLSNSELDF